MSERKNGRRSYRDCRPADQPNERSRKPEFGRTNRDASSPEFVDEPSKTIPVSGEYDVVVVGGGMAGVAAAVAAARCSARVCLVERYCAVGGLATIGNVTIWLPLCDGFGRQVIGGLGEELLRLSVEDLSADNPSAAFRSVPECWTREGTDKEREAARFSAAFNPSSYMLALEKLLCDSGVTIFYDTRFCSVLRSGDRISHIIQENKSGRSALAGKVFVDATGDADVCFGAGEKTVSLDSNTLAGWFYTFENGNLRLHALSRYYSPVGEREGACGPFFRGDNAADVTSHILMTRELLREKVAKLRGKSSGTDVQVMMPAQIACFRMTRRLAGNFTLAEEHAHKWFDDTIGLTGDWRKAGPVFAIPFRCLQAVRNKNLLTAGRCVSVDNTAWDVLRVIPGCVVTGQAAGTAAAEAAQRTDGNVAGLDFRMLKDHLHDACVIMDRSLVENNTKQGSKLR